MRRSGRRAGAAVVTLGLTAIGAAPALGAEAPGLHVSSFRGPAAVIAGDRAAVAGRVAPAQAVPVLVQRLTAAGV